MIASQGRHHAIGPAQGSNLMRTRSKQLSILLLPLALISCLAVAVAKDSSSPPALLLANALGPDIDPAKYLVSEKYDGVRAVWDGKVLRFRSGRTVNAPAWFIAKLPAQGLDGELWLGRRSEEHTSELQSRVDIWY